MCKLSVDFEPPWFILHTVDTKQLSSFLPYHFSNQSSAVHMIKSLLSQMCTTIMCKRQRDTKLPNSIIKWQITGKCFPHTNHHLQRKQLMPNPFHPPIDLPFYPSHLSCRHGRESSLPIRFSNYSILTLLSINIGSHNSSCSIFSHQLNKKSIIPSIRLLAVFNLNFGLIKKQHVNS